MKLLSTIVLAAICILGTFPAYAVQMTSAEIYALSVVGADKELKNIDDINAADTDGNTAICTAIKARNVAAYNALKSAGADIKPDCIKNIPQSQYDAFIGMLGKSQSKTFLGLGKWGWAAIGAGLVGGGAAVAMGGGSGGGGGGETAVENKPEILQCVHGTQNGSVCVCNLGYMGRLCDRLADGFIEGNDGKAYQKLGCVNGVQVNATCSCTYGYAGTLCDMADDNHILDENGNLWPKLDCVHGVQKGGACVCEKRYSGELCDTYTSQRIVIGKKETNQNSLVDINNGVWALIYGVHGGDKANIYNYGQITIKSDADADIYGMYATKWNAGNRGMIDIILNGDGTVYGVYALGNSAWNTSQFETDGIKITTDGVGDVYGLYAFGGVGNGSGKIIINKTGVGDVYGVYGSGGGGNGGTIDITTYDNSDVYGIYAKINDIYNDGILKIVTSGTGDIYGMYAGKNNAENAYGESATIDITANEKGVVYGLYATDKAINAISAGKGNINITKNSDGDVYGLYGLNHTENAGDGNSVPDPISVGNITINKDGSGTVYGAYVKNGDVYNSQSSGVGTIDITTHGKGDIYGLFSEIGEAKNVVSEGTGAINITAYDAGSVFGIYATESAVNSNCGKGTVDITTYADNNIYGIYSKNSATNASYTSNRWSDNIANGSITITSTGNGDIYGGYGEQGAFNAHGDSTGIIKISAVGNGNLYGLFSISGVVVNSMSDNANGLIDITANGIGNVYGMYVGDGDSRNADTGAVGTIDVTMNGDGDAYGIFSLTGSAYNTEVRWAAQNGTTGTINIINGGTGNAYGLYGVNSYNTTETSVINIVNRANKNAVGMYGTANVVNGGTIDIRNLGKGTAIGMYVDGGTATNSGAITINRESFTDTNGTVYASTGTHGGTAIGIYATAGSNVTNTETGVITISGADNAYGIYAESGAMVTNSGTIIIDNNSCSGADCNTGNYIVLNGGKLIQNGELVANSLNLEDMGGRVYATENSKFRVENDMSGDLMVASSSVMHGANTTYTLNDVVNAGDVSGLNVVSGSALFDASLAENGADIVMNMRDFAEFTDNKSLAAFLQNNYAQANNKKLFMGLKSIETVAELGRTLDGFTGHGAFSKITHQDMAMMREIGFTMNEKLFENRDKDDVNFSGGIDYFSFSGSDASGSARFGLSSARVTDNLKLGYGMAMANLSGNSENGMGRTSQMGLFYMPMSYDGNSGYELLVNPKVGFARSEYTRNGLGGAYNGFIERRIFGVMNDLRYPFTFGGLTVAPNLGLNTLVYNQKGHETGGQFGLFIPEDNIVSVEAGLGLYAKYDRGFVNGGRLTLNSGLMAYREFGDCYDMRLGVQGMNGTFSVYGDKAYEYRGAATFGFNYDTGLFNMYGNVQYFVDSDRYMNFKTGLSMRF